MWLWDCMRVSTSEFQSSSHTCIYFANHALSQLDPDFITSYIAEEQAIGHYSAAFHLVDLEWLIGLFHTSPLGLIPKPHTDTFWMIQDMSYPRNHPSVTSINHSINLNNFPTTWDTFDDTAALILSLPAGCLAATFNISAAYCLTPVQPDQKHHLCVFWKDMVYVDQAVMFGLLSSAGIFRSIGDMLITIYRKVGFTQILKWVDNFLVIHLPHQIWMEQEFMIISGSLVLHWFWLEPGVMHCSSPSQKPIQNLFTIGPVAWTWQSIPHT